MLTLQERWEKNQNGFVELFIFMVSFHFLKRQHVWNALKQKKKESLLLAVF